MERGRILSITVASQPEFDAATAFVDCGGLPPLPVLEFPVTFLPAPGPRVGTCIGTFASSFAEALGVKPPRRVSKVDTRRQFRRWWVTLALADDWTRIEFQRGYRTAHGARQAARDWRAGRFKVWVNPAAFASTRDELDTHHEDALRAWAGAG